MKVVIPYVDEVRDGPADLHLVGVQPETLKAVSAVCEPRLERLEWPTDYHDLIARLWAEGETFVVVEQDIVPHAGALREIWECEHDWCAFPYPMQTGDHWALGCTKFSAALMARCPAALQMAGEIDDDGLPKQRHWLRLDSRLLRVLRDHYGEPLAHVHQPPVRHLNPAQDLKREQEIECE